MTNRMGGIGYGEKHGWSKGGAMGTEIAEVADGIVTVRISSCLSEPELADLQRRVAERLRALGQASILVLAETFEGWERGGEWNDFALQEQNDPYILKMAIVGDRQWEELALLFAAKGLRAFPIEFFAPDDLAGARAWLETS
jgi:hypothetical protein